MVMHFNGMRICRMLLLIILTGEFNHSEGPLSVSINIAHGTRGSILSSAG